MREMTKARKLMKKLALKAMAQNWCSCHALGDCHHREASRRDREWTGNDAQMPGSFIKGLSDEERDTLKDLTSEDISTSRPGYIF